MGKKQEEIRQEEKPNKRFSFILGMFIALAIIILFAILFPH
jgi:hypothetical protein